MGTPTHPIPWNLRLLGKLCAPFGMFSLLVIALSIGLGAVSSWGNGLFVFAVGQGVLFVARMVVGMFIYKAMSKPK